MALWFLGSFGWSLAKWWHVGEPIFTLFVVALAALTLCQVLAQRKLTRAATRWAGPAWVKFFLAAAMTSALLVLVELVVNLPALGSFGLRFFVIGWLIVVAGWLGGWYLTWWALLRRGWVKVSTSLIAAGIHASIAGLTTRESMETLASGYLTAMIPVGLFWTRGGAPPVEGPEWLWLAPLGFFGGWTLMFLPSIVAAHECPPCSPAMGRRATRLPARTPPAIRTLASSTVTWGRYCVAWAAPAMAGLVAAALAASIFGPLLR